MIARLRGFISRWERSRLVRVEVGFDEFECRGYYYNVYRGDRLLRCGDEFRTWARVVEATNALPYTFDEVWILDSAQQARDKEYSGGWVVVE